MICLSQSPPNSDCDNSFDTLILAQNGSFQCDLSHELADNQYEQTLANLFIRVMKDQRKMAKNSSFVMMN